MANLLTDLAAEDRPDRGHNNPPDILELLREDLTTRYAARIAAIEPIAKRATDAPEAIKTDADLDIWSQVYFDAKELGDALDRIRLDTAKPLKNAIDEFFKGTVARCERMQEVSRKLSNTYNREKARKAAEEAAAERLRLQTEAEEAAAEASALEAFSQPVEAAAYREEAQAKTDQAAAVAQEAPTAAQATRVELTGGGSASARTVWKYEVEDYEKIDLNDPTLRAHLDNAAIDKALTKYLRQRKEHAKVAGVRFFQDQETAFRK